MELIEGIETRRSIRAFKTISVPEEVMNKILTVVSNSPSYTNTQPWEAVVMSGKKMEELRKILHDLAMAKAPTNPDLLAPPDWPPELKKRAGEHGARKLQILGIERGDVQGREGLNIMNYEFYGAPCVVFLFMDSTLGPWSIFDMGLFAQNFILAAHSFGLGSCLQASVTNYAPEIKKFLGILETKKLIIGIAIGYPDNEAKLNTYRSIKIGTNEFGRWYG